MKKSLIAVVACALVLSGCSSETSETALPTTETSATPATGEYPRTIELEDSSITLETKPERIAVLTPEAASLVLPIAGAERVIMTAEMDTADAETAALASQVEYQIKNGGSLDPEQVIAADPDLVIVSARFATEQGTIDILEGLNVPVVNFDADAWADIDAITKHLDIVGELVGEEDKAAEAIAEIDANRVEIAKPAISPTVLTLMQRGPRQMVMPETSMINGLIREAGGTPVVDSLGATGTITADPEQVVAMAPEIIIIQDFQGKGREDFADFLSNPALASVPAIANGKVFYADTVTTGVTAGTDITTGLQQVAEMIS
ncbi:ABC transporter substrate-binding protein [Corynebacterium crudilactis]|uniref:ABC transporter substrate-binding protein n=1 Tax=Corynebacterium crudilactis TaxID=1652495 RepID=A0A172QRN5_9CORY|nr:ABC transporter substrate-binding protein [Corynebacterium crudilactis]ANE03344.1 ABC transporter substrate-binding protein [Corynebacterium crudilactis]